MRRPRKSQAELAETVVELLGRESDAETVVLIVDAGGAISVYGGGTNEPARVVALLAAVLTLEDVELEEEAS